MKAIFALAVVMTATALPSLAQAQQWGFPQTQRRAPPQRTAYTPPPSTSPVQRIEQLAEQPAEKPVVHDKNSGAYLQSVGRHVADRPLACPPRAARHR